MCPAVPKQPPCQPQREQLQLRFSFIPLPVYACPVSSTCCRLLIPAPLFAVLSFFSIFLSLIFLPVRSVNVTPVLRLLLSRAPNDVALLSF